MKLSPLGWWPATSAAMPSERSLTYPLILMLLAACIVLGGGTRSGFLSDVVLQLIAMAVLVTMVLEDRGFLDVPGEIDTSESARLGRPDRLASVILTGIVTVPLLQVVPLPPAVWTWLRPTVEGRSLSAGLIATADGLRIWLPLSTDPDATWAGWVSLVVPVAMFLGVCRLSAPQRRGLAMAVLGWALLSLVLGLQQVVMGPHQGWRFFEITNPDDAVGFFANRNHFAALLYVGLIVACVYLLEAARRMDPAGDWSQDGKAVLAFAVAFVAVVVLIAGQLFARSRAGLGLSMVALVGVAVIGFVSTVGNHRDALTKSTRRTPRSGRLLLSAIAAALLVTTQFALYRMLDRFEADPLADARIPFARTTLAAAAHYLPFGAGVGTFVPVHARAEPVDVLLAERFANRAHNDVLELWLEMGYAGAGLLVLFAGWIAWRCFRVWRPSAPGSKSDRDLARAATLIVAVLAAHSLVDYPLRTGALVAVFAMACGLLVVPPPSRQLSSAPPLRERRSLRRARAENVA